MIIFFMLTNSKIILEVIKKIQVEIQVMKTTCEMKYTLNGLRTD